MKYLLDTVTFLRFMQRGGELPQKVMDVILSESKLYLSAVSLWEITMKYDARKLPLPIHPRLIAAEILPKHSIKLLLTEMEDIFAVTDLPKIHTDPFDRVLVAQAKNHGMIIITPDEQIHKYEVEVLW